MRAAPRLVNDGAERWIAGQIVADQHFAGAKPGKLAGKVAGAGRRSEQLAGGDVERGKRRTQLRRPSPAGARKIAVRKLWARASSRRLLGERAGRNEADHVAPHHRLRPALTRFGRVLDLLAHRNPVALAIRRWR